MTKRWIAFYDASGSEADRDRSPLLVAGVLSTEHRWTRLDKEWNAVLRQYNVPYLHMREFTAFQGPFASGWRGEAEKQAAFFSALMRPIKRWVNKLWTVYIPQRAFDEVDQIYNLREGTGGPYSLAAYVCVRMITDWWQVKASGRGDPLLHLLASGDKGQHRLRAVAEQGNVVPNFWPTRHPVTAEPFTPFEVADLVAYEYRTEFYRADEPQRTRPVRQVFQALLHIPRFHREATVPALMELCKAYPNIFSRRDSKS